MAHCNDPRLTYLNHLGYNVVKLPRAGVEPLQVLGRDGKSLENLGKLGSIWTSTVPVPQPDPPADAISINGQKTDNLKLSVGLDILSSVLQGMGVPAPKLETAYSRARSVQFTFVNVHVSSVAPLEVGKYLSSGDLDGSNPFVTYFRDHDKEAYVITEVLKSNSITVTAKDEHGVSVGVDMPNLQNVLGAKVSVSTAGSTASDLTFQGTQELAFAFKVFGIGYANGNWQVHGQPASGKIAYMKARAPKAIVLAPSQLLPSFPEQASLRAKAS